MNKSFFVWLIQFFGLGIINVIFYIYWITCDQGKEIKLTEVEEYNIKQYINYLISTTIITLILTISCIVLIGFLLLPIFLCTIVITEIIALFKTSQNKKYKPFFAFEFIK